MSPDTVSVAFGSAATPERRMRSVALKPEITLLGASLPSSRSVPLLPAKTIGPFSWSVWKKE